MQQSWVNVPPSSDFPLQNLPYGIFHTPGKPPRVGVAIGNEIVDLRAVAGLGFFSDLEFDTRVFGSRHLNGFMALGKPVWQQVRRRITELLSENNTALRLHADQVLVRQTEATMLLPVQVGDYTDFYSSLEHATNVGKLFRPDNPLMPNWKHLPVAYHGRASSIVVSGTDFHRPLGQTKPADTDLPVFGASQRLDFELEMAFVIGRDSAMGQRIGTAEAEDFIFGFALFNDWSARDIQAWEYQPLGPFLGKNFASSLSPWIVPLDALEPFRTASPPQEPPVLPYLQCTGNHNTFDIGLEVAIRPQNAPESVVCRSNFKYLYWNICQQLAHHTVNGCNVRTGDVMASGTISGSAPGSFGSLLELTAGGKNAVALAGGATRKFLEDGDMVTMRGFGQKDGLRIGFGEVKGTVLPVA